MAVINRREEYERRRDMRAGLIAATIVNVKRKRGARLTHPGDFFQSRDQKNFMSPDEAARFMDRWAAQQNARLRDAADQAADTHKADA